MATIDEIAEEFFAALKPPPKLSLSDWADEHFYLSAVSSAEAGRWKTIPYQRGIMDTLTDPLIEQVWVMKSARVGWTKMINALVAYHVHQDPCSIMVVQPTVEDAEGYSKEEIAPMIDDVPCLRGLVSDAKAKDGSNTVLSKNYPGGMLGIIGANSPRGFRRVSRRVVLFDEVDGYPIGGAGAEGDQIKLGIRRSEYFWNRKIAGGSTPTIKDLSRIERQFEMGDQRRYFVPCPECGHMAPLVFRKPKDDDKEAVRGHHMAWLENEPHLAYFVCEANGCVIPHSKKRQMVERGEWRATATGSGNVASFHIWAAYSYSPNASWGVLAQEFLDAKADRTLLQTFVNTVLGETWEEEYSARLGAEGLRARAETYEPGVVPEKAVVLVAGVDVQDNRLEITIVGYGRGEESWVVSHDVIFGDPAQAEIWKQLDESLLRPYRHKSGAMLRVMSAAIDSGGHFTHEVYQYARERKARGVIAVKGQSQRGKMAIGKPTKVDVNFRGQVLKHGLDLYPMGSDTIKSVLYGRFKLQDPGPGYTHFHAGLPPEYFEQLVSEKKIVRYVKGFPTYEWVLKPGTRNEALDCKVMAYAALQFLFTKFRRDTFFDQLEKAIEVQKLTPDATHATPIPENAPPKEESPLSKPMAARNMMRTRRRPGFVSGY